MISHINFPLSVPDSRRVSGSRSVYSRFQSRCLAREACILAFNPGAWLAKRAWLLVTTIILNFNSNKKPVNKICNGIYFTLKKINPHILCLIKR